MKPPPSEMERHEQAIAAVERTIRVVRYLALGLVVAGLTIAIFFVTRFSMRPDDLDRLGGFLAGTTGVLWALAGLTLVYVAFLGQQVQVLHQKEDLRLTREAFKQQQLEMQFQTVEFENQRFDNTFFALLGSHQDLVKTSEIDTGTGPKAGAEGFRLLVAKITQRYQDAREKDGTTPSLELAKRIYFDEFRTFEGTLGPYFHSLYHILKFVDDRPLPVDRADERRRYTNFVRARLSFAELIILFYSGLSDQAAGMRSLIERHALLKHLAPDRLLDPEHRAAYRPAAWARPMTKHKEGTAEKVGRLSASSGAQG
jgi:putative phage abortive infection protein